MYIQSSQTLVLPSLHPFSHSLEKGLHFLQSLSDGTLRKGFQIYTEAYGQYIEVHHTHGYDEDVFQEN